MIRTQYNSNVFSHSLLTLWPYQINLEEILTKTIKDDEENSGTRDRDMFLNEKQINSTGGKECVLYLNQRFKISKVKIDRYKQKK